MAKLLKDKTKTKVIIQFDNAKNYVCKEFLYGATKRLAEKYEHLELVMWVPMAPCHGKTDLDRRFSSYTYWIRAFQYDKKIRSVPKMLEVLQDGAKGSNTQRREMGKEPIPTGFSIVKLEPKSENKCFVNQKDLTTINAITYISDPEKRKDRTDSGFYVNGLPWVSWRKGWAIPNSTVKDGNKGYERTAEERKLKPELKAREETPDPDTEEDAKKKKPATLLNQHKKRLASFRKMEDVNFERELKRRRL